MECFGLLGNDLRDIKIKQEVDDKLLAAVITIAGVEVSAKFNHFHSIIGQVKLNMNSLCGETMQNIATIWEVCRK
jgi:hypothetical protein